MSPASSKFDAIVIGASVGGLTAAATLARAGKRVLLLEAEAAPAEPIGALQGLDPQAMTDLKLIAHGLRFSQRDLALTLAGETPLSLSRDRHAASRALASFSDADAKSFAPFRRAMMKEARHLRRFWWSALKDGVPHWVLESKAQKERFDRLSLSGAEAWLRAHFESDALLSLLLWDSTGGGFSPSEPGSALALLWRASQEMAGLQGAVAMPEPGTLITALKLAASGAELRAYARVTAIITEQGAVRGVTLDDGETIAAPQILSAVSNAQTCALMGATPPRRADVGEARLLLTLGEPVQLGAARMVIAERPGVFVDAHEEARAGKIPTELPMEFAQVDSHRLAVTVRPVPAVPPQDWKAQLAARVLRTIGRHVPGLATNVTHIAFSHSAPRVGLAHLLAPAGARILSGTDGLYLCGADAEPLPSLSGRAGRIAAQFALQAAAL